MNTNEILKSLSSTTLSVPHVLRPEVTMTSDLLITAEEFSAGGVGILSMEYVNDGMRQTGNLSSKVVFSRGITGEVCVISIEPVCNPSAANRCYGRDGWLVPVTFVTVAITEDAVHYLTGEGMNTLGDYVKFNGKTVSKKGAGYGMTVSTCDVDVLAFVVRDIVRNSLSADYGRAVADPKAWKPEVAMWLHDDRFRNGGQVTGASKKAVKVEPSKWAKEE